MEGFRKFWMVWCLGGGPPTFMHPTEHEAKQEAVRLARLNRGQRFVVLESLYSACVTDVQWSHATDDGEIPF